MEQIENYSLKYLYILNGGNVCKIDVNYCIYICDGKLEYI